MSKGDPDSSRKERNKTIRWILIIFPVTILVSGTISLISDIIMEGSSMLVAFLILLAIVFLGVLADTIGLSVTTADEKPFHSMAARKVPGSLEAIRLLRNADRVSSICTAVSDNASEGSTDQGGDNGNGGNGGDGGQGGENEE